MTGNSVTFGLGCVCRVVCAPLSSPAEYSDLQRVAWGWLEGREYGEYEQAAQRGTCVVYSVSDGDSLMVQNELSLGALSKNNTIHFYSNACYTKSLVAGGSRLIGHACGGTLLCPFLSLAPNFLKGTGDAWHAGW